MTHFELCVGQALPAGAVGDQPEGFLTDVLRFLQNNKEVIG